MQEIAPGLWHWTALRESIGSDVDSYYLAEEGIAIDPMLPQEQPEWFRPEHAILTCRHHDRDAWRLGCTVWVVEQGAHELEGRGEFRTFAWGDELPGGIVACEVGGISPDETALHIPGRNALAVADGVVRWERGGPLTFVPDSFMDDPERDKAALLGSFRRLLDELAFAHVLLAHGGPATRSELQAFVDAGGSA